MCLRFINRGEKIRCEFTSSPAARRDRFDGFSCVVETATIPRFLVFSLYFIANSSTVLTNNAKDLSCDLMPSKFKLMCKNAGILQLALDNMDITAIASPNSFDLVSLLTFNVF